MKVNEFWSRFVEALVRLATSRKFILALTAFLTVLSQYFAGTVDINFLMQSLTNLVLTVIVCMAAEDVARNFSGGGPEVVNVNAPRAETVNTTTTTQSDPPEKVGTST